MSFDDSSTVNLEDSFAVDSDDFFPPVSLGGTVKPAFSGPSDEGAPAFLGHFCLAQTGFQV